MSDNEFLETMFDCRRTGTICSCQHQFVVPDSMRIRVLNRNGAINKLDHKVFATTKIERYLIRLGK